ncbi:nitrite reductase small subunit NirD [Nesterenkonia natronophila]|uniref:Nitrite reductase (NAD(P)H) small subunit n=1 Tax=Nesterenkonia natronophila TaxID=2174932 RepID=A0A3A4FBN7_9MICC|nr:nitrite reductase small subunit NirD [Nesterenkonia natronophila]RJN32214.1 nitrite reductase (NAD(P)H) small subunit [Nesterenkonia natronophila]
MATAVLERLISAPTDGAQGAWREICPLDELEPLWGEAALLHGAQIALVRLPDDRVLAVDHWDPRAQANVMARGIVGSAEGRTTLASPIYKQVYDLETGECVSEPGPPLTTYPVRVASGQVQVFL